GPRATRTVGPARFALPGRTLVAPGLGFDGRLLAETLDQHAAAFAVGEQAGPLLCGRLLLRAPGLVRSAAVMPAQRRIVLAPRVSAARRAARLVGALAVAPSIVSALVATVRPARGLVGAAVAR